MKNALLNIGIDLGKIVLISNALPDEVGDRANNVLDEKFVEFRKHQ